MLILKFRILFIGSIYKTILYVIVNYEGDHYPGRVLGLPYNENVTVSCLEKVYSAPGSIWKWPQKEDIIDVELSNILKAMYRAFSYT